MNREFIPFDEEVIQKELNSLTSKDASKLVSLMEHYQNTGTENPSPAKIDEYGQGLYRLRHVKSAYQGRAIFLTIDRKLKFERLILLVVYKKEGQKTPQRILNLALRRKKEWENLQ